VLGCFLGFCLGLDVCFGFGLGLGVDFGLRCFFANLRRALPNEMGLLEGIRLEGIRWWRYSSLEFKFVSESRVVVIVSEQYLESVAHELVEVGRSRSESQTVVV
jgi:hypothetical protein